MKHIAVMAQWKEDFREAIWEYNGQQDLPDDLICELEGPYVVEFCGATYHQVKNSRQLDCIRFPLAGVLVSDEIRDVLSANDFDYLYERLKRKVDNETT